MAMGSAWKIQKPESIWLVHEGLEKKGDGWDAIKDIPVLQLMEANDKNFEGLHDDGLCRSLFHTLKSPASRANLLRLALLYKEGGGYLDDMIFADTRIVHWYNSVEERFLKTKLDRAWFEQHPDTAFAEMVRRYATK